MKSLIWVYAFLFIVAGCKRDPLSVAADYPEEVGRIIRTKCSSPACHSSTGKINSNGLDLSSWEQLYNGSYHNAVVIPYHPELSLMYALVNITDHADHDRMMPKEGSPLTPLEIMVLKNWIRDGAKNRAEALRFPENKDRDKIYVANQGCDVVTVFDAESKMIMGVIPVGKTNSIESPHDMFVSPDGKHLYISFFANSMIQRYETATGLFDGEIALGDWGWHSMSVSGDSRFALVSHLNGDGKVVLLDLQKMETVVKYQGSGYFIYPHGSAMNLNGSLAYITAQQGNFIYKMDITQPLNPEQSMITLDPTETPSPMGIYKPYEVEFSPDYQSYYVSCQGTNEIRIFQTSNDSLTGIIKTPGVPQLMAFSIKEPYMFVTCMEDSANLSTHSSVAVINIQTKQLIKSIETGYQPRGLAVDDKSGFVYVANRNISGTGWTPHHTTSCGERNGYITLINMKTLELEMNWQAEVSVDPYSVAIRK